MLTNLHFVTSNEGKALEVQAILGFPITIAKLEIDEIQDIDLKKIAYKKVSTAFEEIKQPVIVDDAGLFVEAWNQFPGPFVKFIDKAGGNELMLQMMKAETNRKAIFKSVIAYHDGISINIFEGEVLGEITTEMRGKGWGFEPIFVPVGYSQTFAELSEEVKNSLSHRKMALEKFKEFLSQQGSNI